MFNKQKSEYGIVRISLYCILSGILTSSQMITIEEGQPMNLRCCSETSNYTCRLRHTPFGNSISTVKCDTINANCDTERYRFVLKDLCCTFLVVKTNNSDIGHFSCYTGGIEKAIVYVVNRSTTDSWNTFNNNLGVTTVSTGPLISSDHLSPGIIFGIIIAIIIVIIVVCVLVFIIYHLCVTNSYVCHRPLPSSTTQDTRLGTPDETNNDLAVSYTAANNGILVNTLTDSQYNPNSVEAERLRPVESLSITSLSRNSGVILPETISSRNHNGDKPGLSTSRDSDCATSEGKSETSLHVPLKNSGDAEPECQTIPAEISSIYAFLRYIDISQLSREDINNFKRLALKPNKSQLEEDLMLKRKKLLLCKNHDIQKNALKHNFEDKLADSTDAYKAKKVEIEYRYRWKIQNINDTHETGENKLKLVNRQKLMQKEELAKLNVEYDSEQNKIIREKNKAATELQTAISHELDGFEIDMVEYQSKNETDEGKIVKPEEKYDRNIGVKPRAARHDAGQDSSASYIPPSNERQSNVNTDEKETEFLLKSEPEHSDED